MRRYIILLSLLMLLFSCGESKHNGYTLTVKLDVPEQSYLYFWQEEFKQGITVDSVLVEEGKGVFKGVSNDITRVEICTEAGERILWLYVKNGEKIELKGEAKKPYLITMSGTPTHETIGRFHNDNHELLQRIHDNDTAYYTHLGDTAYRHTMQRDLDTLYRRVHDFVLANPASMASTLLIYDYLLSPRTAEMADTLLRRLPPETKPVSLLAKAELFISGNDKHPEGKMLPYMTFRTATDSVVNTGGFRRRTTLLTVWASYDTLSRAQLQVVRRLTAKHKRSFLNAVCISVDTDDEAWRNALQLDSITTGVHCRLKEGWGAGQIENLGVRTLPATFLINGAGKIVHKNLLGNELEAVTDSLIQIVGEDENLNEQTKKSSTKKPSRNAAKKNNKK